MIWTRRTLISLLALAAVLVGFPSAAGAGVGTFSMSPTSGPPGTDVFVSGSGCSPGLWLSASLDFVAVVATTAPPVSTHLAVGANGDWSGTFTIPPNARSAPAAVSVVCVSDGLQSLLTLYVPATFTVTSPPNPTTTATSPPSPVATSTNPPTTGFAPTTTVGGLPGPPGTNPPSTTTPGHNHQPGRKPVAGHGGGGATTPNSGGSATHPANPNGPPSPNALPGSGSNPKGAHAHSTQNPRNGPSAQAADLNAPTLASAIQSDSAGGLGWLAWLLAFAILAALAGAGAWWFRWRRRDTVTPLTEPYG